MQVIRTSRQVIDSDNETPRCGCPARYALESSGLSSPWTARIILRDGDLIAECRICGAAWEWGSICAADDKQKREEPSP